MCELAAVSRTQRVEGGVEGVGKSAEEWRPTVSEELELASVVILAVSSIFSFPLSDFFSLLAINLWHSFQLCPIDLEFE
jgi:hypothetical protein